MGRECSFGDFMDEASRNSQEAYPLFQPRKIKSDRAVLTGHRFHSSHTHTNIHFEAFNSLNTLFSRALRVLSERTVKSLFQPLT